MTSNFTFLKETEQAEFFENARQAEQHALTAPVTSAFYSRLCVEQIVNWLYEEDGELEEPYQRTLVARMNEPSFGRVVPSSIRRELHYIRKEGNEAVHGSRVSQHVSVASLGYLHRFLSWVVRLYNVQTVDVPPFSDKHLPAVGFAELQASRLTQLQTNYDKKEAALQAEREQRLKIEAELEKLKARQAEVKKVKASHQDIPLPPQPFSEAETRRIFIDALLRDAGWNAAAPNTSEYPVTGMPLTSNKSGRGSADYVLWGDDGLPLAVIEAKKTSVEGYQGQHQAELYADCLEKMHGQRPIIFFTNGFETHIWDDAFYPPRRVHGLYTKPELQLLINRRKTRQDLRKYEVREEIAGRPYQIEALQRVAEAYVGEEDGKLRGNKRAALLVMATGAGKTRTAASITDMLTKFQWAKRVLFLADRNALVNQAKRSFHKMLPNLTSIDLTKEKDNVEARLVFSTYPTIMNRIDSARAEEERFYGVGHFDLIIIDEAHRSVYQKYGAIFEYFDALLLGLTATPKGEEGNRDTYRLFDCEEHNPTFAYELDEAVANKYLVPPRGKKVDLGFMSRGIRYTDLSDSEKAIYEATFRDEQDQIPEVINASAIHQWLYNADTIDKMLHHLMTAGIKVAGGDKIGKTIIFAQNRMHSLEILKRFDKQFPTLGGNFLKIVDHKDKYAQQTIDDFSEKEKMPQIVVSVDMLDTGIDVPELVNLVFFKSVYSSSKYWQMIGRGTRLCPDLFAPGEDKAFFYIFDFCNNFEFFDHTPDGINTTIPTSISQRILETKLEIAQVIRRDALTELEDYRKELLDFCHAQVDNLYEQRENFRIRMSLKVINDYRRRQRWNQLTPQDVSELVVNLAPLVQLRDDDEQAKRFDVLMLQLELAKLDENRRLAQNLTRKVIRLGQGLQEIVHIPQVAAQRTQVAATQSAEWWQDAGILDLESIRESLRSLIRLIEKDKKRVVFTPFTDTIDDEFDELELIAGYTQMENYRQRVERYLQENKNHLTVRKLRTNQPITQLELEALERLLFEENDLNQERYEQEFGDQPLGEFVRSVIGMDTKAVNDAFGVWLQKGNLRADQITFLKTIVDHFVENGILEKQKLATSPFTDIHSMGIFGVFREEEYTEIVSIIDWVNGNARVG
jgi:type I restriction enzyme R subunit